MLRHSMKDLLMVAFIFVFLFSANHCFSYEIQIVNNFDNPIKGRISDLTYHDGYLYAVTGAGPYVGAEKIYKIDPVDGTYLDFLEKYDEDYMQLKFITSCDNDLYVFREPWSLGAMDYYEIYKMNPVDNTWNLFFVPDAAVSQGLACNTLSLILAERDYIYTVSLSTQVETSRNKLLTSAYLHGMTWDGEYVWSSSYDALYKIDLSNGSIIKEIELSDTIDISASGGLTYDGEFFWTYVSSLNTWSPYAGDIVQLKIISDSSSTTTTPESTTTTTTPDSSTTTTYSSCASEFILADDSDNLDLLRNFRDNFLSKTPEGQEIIRLYYEWSPMIVRAMQKDEGFKEEVKEMIDRILLMIRESVE